MENSPRPPSYDMVTWWNVESMHCEWKYQLVNMYSPQREEIEYHGKWVPITGWKCKVWWVNTKLDLKHATFHSMNTIRPAACVTRYQWLAGRYGDTTAQLIIEHQFRAKFNKEPPNHNVRPAPWLDDIARNHRRHGLSNIMSPRFNVSP